MKRFATCVITVLFGMALSSPAFAQQRDRQTQRDLEVTISVVPADASADAAVTPIELPKDAAPEARTNAEFGLNTANRARAGDVGRDFGQDIARERAGERLQNIELPKIGK